MKLFKFIATVIFTIICVQFANAQSEFYTFSSSVETFEQITDGTILGTSANNNESFNGIPLGFFFNYLGTDYTEVSVNTDGFLAMGGAVTNSASCLSAGATNNVISALNLNIAGISSLGQMMYEIRGEAPDRVFTVQWLNYQFSGAAGNGDNFNFQIKLYESSNKIEFCYGNFTKNTSARTAQIGLRGASNLEVMNRSVVTGTNTWETSVPGAANNASCALVQANLPSDGLVYRWAIVEQEYKSSTVEQITGFVLQGNDNEPIIKIKVATEGALERLHLTSLSLNTNGSTNPASDITNARVFYTGNYDFFFAEQEFGEFNNPDGEFLITGSQELAPNDNYFWLTYSISGDATPWNIVDAECTEIIVDGINYTPTETNPSGSRAIRVPFNGTYTIGEGGNYPSLALAFEEVNVLGLSGNTTFEIISDISETIPAMLNEWAEIGAGDYFLTIKPSGQMRTISGSLNNGVITLNGADRVIIDGRIDGEGNFLTITNNNAGSASAAIRLLSLGANAGCENVTIRNCNIFGASPIFTTSFGIHVAGEAFTATSAGAHNHNLSIIDNQIQRAYYGVFIRGVATTGLNDNLLIEGNEIGSSDFDYRIGFEGIEVQNSINSLITRNHVFGLYNPSAFVLYGIMARGNIDNSVISYNHVHDLKLRGASSIFMPAENGTSGIDVSSAGNKFTIANNLVYDITGDNNKALNSFTVYGISVRAGDSVNVYFNSVNIYGGPLMPSTSGTRSAALAIASSISGTINNVDVRDNTLVNSFEGLSDSESYAFYSDATAERYVDIDYNNYYTSGQHSKFAYLAGPKISLQELQTATGRDKNSISESPLYTSNDNLYPLFSSPLMFAGTQIEGFSEDILGIERSQSPTIGAYELVSSGNMTYLYSNTEQYNNAPIMIGDADQEIILVKIVTRGADNPLNLNSISFNMNGTTNPGGDILEAKVFYTGSSQYFSSETQYGTAANPLEEFTVTGNLELQPGANYFWLAYSSSSSAENMNYADGECLGFEIEGVTYVPTVTAPEGRRQLRTYFDGVYTVGAGGVYSSLYQAFNDIAYLGLSGNTTLLIVSDIEEPYPAVIDEWDEVGIGGYYLSIMPDESLRTIEANIANDAVLVIRAAKRVILDGRIDGKGKNLLIRNNNIAAQSSAVRVASLGVGMGCDDITIRNCIISGSDANYSSAYALVVGGASSMAANGASNNNVSIIENDIIRATWGITVRGLQTTGYNENLIIKGNTVGSNIPEDKISLKGIFIGNSPGSLISENTVFGFDADPYTNMIGIEIGNDNANTIVSNNRVHSLYMQGNHGVAGIQVSFSTSNNDIEIVNNSIYDIRSTNNSSTSLTENPFGIKIDYGADIKVYHNSVNLYGEQFPSGSSGTLSAALLISSTVVSVDVKNNVFANSLSGLAGSSSYAIYSAMPASKFIDINYNDYYASGEFAILGYLGSNKYNIGDWIDASGYDDFSISADPLFLSDYPLFIDEYSPLIGQALQLEGYETDILGNDRLENPTIGAFEYHDNIILAAPVLSSPANEETNVTVIKNFTWEENFDVDFYRIQIASDPDFNEIVYDKSDVYATNWQNASPFSNSSTYYWRVEGVAEKMLSTWSEVWEFSTLAPLDSPLLLSPNNESTNNAINPILTWSEVQDADFYRVELSLEQDFSSLLYSTELSSTSIQIPIELEYETIYFWQVKARNNEGNSSTWSQTRSFTTMQAPAVPWEVIETNNSSIVIVPLDCDISIEGRAVEINDGFGLFYQTDPGVWNCAGYGIWNGEASLGITVWGDNNGTEEKDGYAIGEPYTFRIWDGTEKIEYQAVANFSLGSDSYEVNGFSIVESLSTDISQTINLSIGAGWNAISSYVDPIEKPMPSIFANILPYIRMVKNNFGQMFVPAWGLNAVGDWNVNHGYLVNLSSQRNLAIAGIPIQPEIHPINLNEGWNLTSYIRNNPMGPIEATQSLGNSLILVKNSAGGVYSPVFAINTLGNMLPGQGYFYYLNSSAALTYPANSFFKTAFVSEITPQALHLSPKATSTGNDATLFVECGKIEDAHEIGVYNLKNELIGAGAINNGIAAITIWGDNEISDEIDGALLNEPLTLKLFDIANSSLKDISLTNLQEITSGLELDALYYSPNAIYFGKAYLGDNLNTDFSIKSIPNPVETSAVFEFNLLEESQADIMIYTSTGELVASVGAGNYSAGIHRISFDASNFANGMYNIVLSADGKRVSTLMIISK